MSQKKSGLGAKTFTLLSLVVLTSCLAYFRGRLQIEYLKNLSSVASFFLGLFTFLTGASLMNFLDLKNPSFSYIRFSKDVIFVGNNPSIHGRDFPYVIRVIFSFLICFFIGVLYLNNRTSDLLVEAPHKWITGGSFCPTNEKQGINKSDKPVPGCQLVERAFELGLVSDISSCETHGTEDKLELCTLRQRDEPLLHYSARRLVEFIVDTGNSWQHFSFWKKTENVFLERLAHWETLFRHLAYVVEGTPKASHHIFTNLPMPKGTFDKNKCLSRYRELSPIMKINPGDQNSISQVLDHIYGQMLFDPQFDNSAGICKEYTIHWNSPTDSCERLAQQPEVFLKSQGISTQIEKLFDRAAEHLDLKRMQFKLRYIMTGIQELPPPPPPPLGPTDKKPQAYPTEETVISFQCLIQGTEKEKSSVKELPFQLYNHHFVAREVRFPFSPEDLQIHMEMYKYFAQVMAGDDFHYQHSATREAQDAVNQWHIGPQFFSKGDYPLTRLEFLKQTNIFLGNSWLQSREDLLEIYPYYHHLNYFINLFRDEYRSQRTRL